MPALAEYVKTEIVNGVEYETNIIKLFKNIKNNAIINLANLRGLYFRKVEPRKEPHFYANDGDIAFGLVKMYKVGAGNLAQRQKPPT